MGEWLFNTNDFRPMVSRPWIGLLSFLLCWHHSRAVVRGRELSGGHWLWFAGLAAGVIGFLLCHRGGWTGEAMAAIPLTLICAACWICGWHGGRGFVFPFLLLLLLVPWVELSNLNFRWQFQFDKVLVEQFGEQLQALRKAAWDSKWYNFCPSPGNILVTGVALCGITRWRWWILILTAAAALAAGHVVLWSYPSGC